jgi:autotransporter-associated beta strand protein
VGGVVPVSGDAVTISPGHTVSLTAAVNIGAGSLTVSGTLELAGFNMTAGPLSGSGNISSVSGTPVLSVSGANPPSTYSGIYSGGGSLNLTGGNTLILSGANTYSGSTTISSGTLQISADNNLGTPPSSPTPGHLIFNFGRLSVTGSFTLNSNRGISAPTTTSNATFQCEPGSVLTYGGIIAGPGGLAKFRQGTLILSGANTYFGTTNISAGPIRLGASGVIPDGSTVTFGNSSNIPTLDLNGYNETVGPLSSSNPSNGVITSSAEGAATLTTRSNTNSTFFGRI